MKESKPVLCTVCEQPWGDHAAGGNCKHPPIRPVAQAGQVLPNGMVYLPRGSDPALIAAFRRAGVRLWFATEDSERAR